MPEENAKTTLSEKELMDKYLETLTEKELKSYHIAVSHLGTSFQLEKSCGYLDWKKKYIQTQSIQWT